jgi:cadmium resistance protein CadD (predicted permease)
MNDTKVIDTNALRSNTQNAGHLIAILSWLVLFIMATVTASVLAVDFMGTKLEKPDSIFWPIVFAWYGFGFILMITAHGLKQHQQWARYLGSFLGSISIIAFPVGTVMGLFILSYLHKGWHEK